MKKVLQPMTTTVTIWPVTIMTFTKAHNMMKSTQLTLTKVLYFKFFIQIPCISQTSHRSNLNELTSWTWLMNLKIYHKTFKNKLCANQCPCWRDLASSFQETWLSIPPSWPGHNQLVDTSLVVVYFYRTITKVLSTLNSKIFFYLTNLQTHRWYT